jgi:predicted RNA-binding Zn-ribbon protein involved in translation (DUF1610 family)
MSRTPVVATGCSTEGAPGQQRTRALEETPRICVSCCRHGGVLSTQRARRLSCPRCGQSAALPTELSDFQAEHGASIESVRVRIEENGRAASLRQLDRLH